MSWVPDDARTLAPAIRSLWLLSSAIVSLVLGGGVALATELAELVPGPVVSGLASFGFALAILAVITRLRYRYWWYAMRSGELVVGCGIWFRSRTCVPKARIQHVDLDAGPLLRRVGLLSVSIYTAGSATAAITIPALPANEAETLRAWLVEGA